MTDLLTLSLYSTHPFHSPETLYVPIMMRPSAQLLSKAIASSSRVAVRPSPSLLARATCATSWCHTPGQQRSYHQKVIDHYERPQNVSCHGVSVLSLTKFAIVEILVRLSDITSRSVLCREMTWTSALASSAHQREYPCPIIRPCTSAATFFP